LQQTDLDGIRRVAQETQTLQPGNYVFCDATGEIADLELTPEGPVWLEDREGFFVHTNHFLGEPFAGRDDLPPALADSLPRYERLRSLAEAAYGQITVSLVQQFLSDHANYPVSLCRHEDPPGMFTSASLIAEPERGILHVCAGNPCEGEFVSYCF
jgi:isopenicillin-N N-acyltransferase-like protein